jgi:hypothetical protein
MSSYELRALAVRSKRPHPAKLFGAPPCIVVAISRREHEIVSPAP